MKFQVMLAAAALLALSGPALAQTAPGCTTAESRQFDFWVGRWEVFDTHTGARAGSSLIERLYGGCAIRENWSDPQTQGGSLNYYDPVVGRWRQLWLDQGGHHQDYVGGLQDGRMVLVAEAATGVPSQRPVKVRMTFTANPDGSVRQYSDTSLDGGATWKERYDFTYRPLK